MLKKNHLLLTKEDDEKADTLEASKGEIGTWERSEKGGSKDITNDWKFTNENRDTNHHNRTNEDVMR